MVIYYTGTGNSRFLAKIISKELQDELVDATELIRNNENREFYSEKPYVFVCPTYAWRIPKIFEKFIMDNNFKGNQSAYFVMNCGTNIGNAKKYIDKLCNIKNLQFRGVQEILMPENYICMFEAPSEQEEKEILAKAEKTAAETAEIIGDKKTDIKSRKVKPSEIIQSDVVNWAFYKFCVKDKDFYVKEDLCISCGLCEKLCVTKNITLVDGKPIWNGNCTHCQACINRCPKEAIEYGKHSIGLRRYYLDC